MNAYRRVLLVGTALAVLRMAEGVPHLPIPKPGDCAIVCHEDDSTEDAGDNYPENQQ